MGAKKSRWGLDLKFSLEIKIKNVSVQSPSPCPLDRFKPPNHEIPIEVRLSVCLRHFETFLWRFDQMKYADLHVTGCLVG